MVRITDATQTAALVIAHPHESNGPFDRPREPAELQQIVDGMKRRVQQRSPVADVLAFGQTWGEPNRIEIWTEWSSEGRHFWNFDTGLAGHAIDVSLVVTRMGASASDFKQLDAITADAGAMLRRLRMSSAQ